jgi:hypothetical protein
MFEEFPARIDTLKGSTDAAGLVAVAVDWAKVAAAAEAQRLAIIAEYAAGWMAAAGDDTSLYWVDEEDDVIGEISSAFGISCGWAMTDLQIGAAMRERFPNLAALFLRGEISAKVMATVVDRTMLVTDSDALALIDAACVTAATKHGWSGLSYYKLKNAVDVWVDRYDPAAVRRVRDHVRQRGVHVSSTDEKSGTTVIVARLTTPGAALLMGRLRKMAKGVCAEDPRTLDQKLADALEALAADANHLKCLCGSPTCAATADDGVASRYVVHIYAEAAALDVAPDPLIHGDHPDDEPVRPTNVTIKYPTTSGASPTGEAPQDADAVVAEPDATGDKSEPVDVADEPGPSTPRHCAAPTSSPSADNAGEPEPEAPEAQTVEGLENAAAESASPGTATASPPLIRVGPPAGIIPGFTIVPAALLAALIAGGATVRPLKAPGVDPESGYWIPDELRHWVKARDLVCRFPGCDRPIELCDLDHTIAWDDGGPTHASDLKGYCRHHHGVKTFRDGWSEVQLPDGTLILTTPTGRTYKTIPTSRLLFPTVNTTSAPITPGSPRKPRGPDKTAKMPKRKRSKAQQRAYRIAAERALNEAYIAAHTTPPPF